LGYVEGKNIIIEYRYADGRFERLPALAEELVRLKVDIIVADTTASARGAKKATSTIPIVIASGSDPIESGLVASLAHPGGNVTGLTNYGGTLLGKRLELLKEVVPKVSRFAFLDDGQGFSRSVFKETQGAAQILGVKLQLIEVKFPDPDLEGAFRAMAKERIGALITGAGPLGLALHRKRILELVQQSRMPAIYPSVSWIDAGGLMYYGTNVPDLYRRAAIYVDKILKGATPAGLPVEQPMKFDLGINLKAARLIGLTIPPNVLARADTVIK
jgi:putative ABC transport system substrate-binding protein